MTSAWLSPRPLLPPGLPLTHRCKKMGTMIPLSALCSAVTFTRSGALRTAGAAAAAPRALLAATVLAEAAVQAPSPEPLLYDTKARAFIDASPQRSLAKALQTRPGPPRVIFVAEEGAHEPAAA